MFDVHGAAVDEDDLVFFFLFEVGQAFGDCIESLPEFEAGGVAVAARDLGADEVREAFGIREGVVTDGVEDALLVFGGGGRDDDGRRFGAGSDGFG